MARLLRILVFAISALAVIAMVTMLLRFKPLTLEEPDNSALLDLQRKLAETEERISKRSALLARDRASNDQKKPSWPPNDHMATEYESLKRLPDGLEYFTYKHVCLDENAWVVFFDDKQKHREMCDLVPDPYRSWNTRLHYGADVNTPMPFRGLHYAMWMSWAGFQRDVDAAKSQVEWVNGHTFLQRFHGFGRNIYHFTERAMPGFAARVQALEDRLPMDQVQAALNEADGCEAGKVFDRVIISDPDPHEANNAGFSNKYNTNILFLCFGSPNCTQYEYGIRAEPNTYRCFERLTIGGSSVAIMPGVRYAQRFRGMLKHKFGAEFSRDVVTVVKRGDRAPHPDHDAMISHVKKITGRPVEEVALETLTFEDEVKQLARSGVIIGTFGAHWTNLIMAPKLSVAIEMSPHRILTYTFRRIALNLGIWHFPLEAMQDEECMKEVLNMSHREVWDLWEEGHFEYNTPVFYDLGLKCPLLIDMREFCKTVGIAASIAFGQPHMGTLDCPPL